MSASAAPPPRNLLADLALTPAGGGRYDAALDDAWSFRAPSGGVLMALTLRALRHELARDELCLRSATVTFCRQVLPGALRVHTRRLHVGKSAAQLAGELLAAEGGAGGRPSAPTPNDHEAHDGRGAPPGPGLLAAATFGAARRGFEFQDATPPEVPPPEACAGTGALVPFRPDFVPSFYANFEVRRALGADWWGADWGAGPARFARWFRYRVPPRGADGRLDPLALCPLADTMPSAVVPRLGPGFRPFIAPSLDLTAHFLDTTEADGWILAVTRVRRAGEGYAAGDVELWSRDGRLLLVGSQVMTFRDPPSGLGATRADEA